MRLVDPEVWKLDLLLFHGCNEKTAWLIDRINHAPTIDAVPVIRCKDCKHWCTDDGMFKDIDERQWHHCSHIGIDTEEYFFCSEAERKEE